MLNIHFRAVNYRADITLEEFAQKRLEKLTIFYNQIIDMYCFTKVENTSDKINKWVELKIEIAGENVIVKKMCRTFEEAINSAADSAERILKRRKEKIKA
jgi:putative sigma-54 modulation protein|tara:strand:- start:165 stop:464 length:300 start_codon:yes stop_codon:yes gene_type:complete